MQKGLGHYTIAVQILIRIGGAVEAQAVGGFIRIVNAVAIGVRCAEGVDSDRGVVSRLQVILI